MSVGELHGNHDTHVVLKDSHITLPVSVADTVTVQLDDTWEIAILKDAVNPTNNQAITLDVAYTQYYILWIWGEVITSAVAGNRQMELQIQDNTTDIIFRIVPDLVQAASLPYHYLFAPAMADLDAVRDGDWVSTPLPPTVFVAGGSTIRLFDNSGISANDQITLIVGIGRRP